MYAAETTGEIAIKRSMPMSEPMAEESVRTRIEELFALHNGEIYAYLLRMVRDGELAADLTQDTFVKAYRRFDTLQEPEPGGVLPPEFPAAPSNAYRLVRMARDQAPAWYTRLKTALRRPMSVDYRAMPLGLALDDIRHRRIIRMVPWTGESRGAAPSAEHLFMDARLSGPMQRALGRMPERQRSALLLAELQDLTGLELAAALGVSHVAARALLTRARESLRQALAAERERDAVAEAAAAARAGASTASSAQRSLRSSGGSGLRANDQHDRGDRSTSVSGAGRAITAPCGASRGTPRRRIGLHSSFPPSVSMSRSMEIRPSGWKTTSRVVCPAPRLRGPMQPTVPSCGRFAMGRSRSLRVTCGHEHRRPWTPQGPGGRLPRVTPRPAKSLPHGFAASTPRRFRSRCWRASWPSPSSWSAPSAA